MHDISDNKWVSMSDKAISESIGAFIRSHRLNQNRSQQDLAKDAGISRSTLSLLERGESVTLNSLLQVIRVLDLLYILEVFNVEDEISPLEYAKLKKKQRQRAGKDNEDKREASEW